MRSLVHFRDERRHNRRPLLFLSLSIFMVFFFRAPLGALAEGEAFTPSVVLEKARILSTKPYQAPVDEVPEFLRNLSYDAWRDIRFRPEKALWIEEKLPFQLQFFHPGLYYDRTVDINIVTGGKTSRLPFDVKTFDYGRNNIAERISPQMGFAGFRIHGPINTKKYFDEIGVFLGASYFRAVAKGQVYGLSARGLAVNTALRQGEEFPYFREFWIEKPGPKSNSLTIHALLDSESLTGAFTFKVRGGSATTMDVKSTYFLRKPVEKFGLGPLTSMFLFGENTSVRNVDDFRPEVHDSDGLLMSLASGEWLWRPLSNPGTLQTDTFEADDPLGFGLLQRDSAFHNYEDLEARYEKRPSLWVQPKGRWGKGHVELVLIPTDKEIHDNVVAYWVPEGELPLGQPLEYDYALSWDSGQAKRPPAGFTSATRTAADETGGRLFVIDFEGKALSLLPAETRVEGVVSCGPGAIIAEQHVVKNDVTGGWRLSFLVKMDEATPMEMVMPNKRPSVDLRAFLRVNQVVLTETWNYAFKP
ncbi:MAG: glucan biosynthesis protein G [Proteobacteria bacterium]|nr:glucan biosynthesis protein G [Pseudomonadota bacterium]